MRLRARDRGRYLHAIDEARENVREARRDYHDALDELSDLEEMAVGPERADRGRPARPRGVVLTRRRGQR